MPPYDLNDSWISPQVVENASLNSSSISRESIILKFKVSGGVDVNALHADVLGANVAVQVAAMIDDGA